MVNDVRKGVMNAEHQIHNVEHIVDSFSGSSTSEEEELRKAEREAEKVLNASLSIAATAENSFRRSSWDNKDHQRTEELTW